MFENDHIEKKNFICLRYEINDLKNYIAPTYLIFLN